jgi:DHA1 family bicyclomycin/chloramphenicol resistance-like MFS transporter
MVSSLGWRPIFAALAGLAVFDLVLARFALPRAYSPDPSISLQPGPILRTFRDVLAERQFLVYTLAGSLSFAGLFVFVSGSPAVFMEGFGVSAQLFGGIFAILAGGMILGGQLNHLLVHYRDSRYVFRVALRLQIATAVLFLVGVLTVGLGLWATVGVLFVFLLCAGVTYPNAAALAIEPFSRNIGSASSLLGFLQLGVGSIAAAILGLLDVKGPLPMAVVMATCCIAGGLVLKFLAGKPVPAIAARAVAND